MSPHAYIWIGLGALYLLVIVFFIALGKSAKEADRQQARAAARHRRQRREEAARHLDRCPDRTCPCWRDDAVYPDSFLGRGKEGAEEGPS